MDFEKKMKLRLYIGIAYCAIGIILVLAGILNHFDNHFISSFGFALLAIGILRIVQNHKTTKSEKAMHRREIAESDERNRMISERAKSWAFSFSITLSGIVVIILSVMGYHDLAQPFSWFVCLMVALYWVFWMVASRKF